LLLTLFGNQRECITVASSCFHHAENCLKYDIEKSNPERILCEQCKPNFAINENLICSPAFESSKDKDNTNQSSARNSQDNNEELLTEKTVFLILVGLIVGLGVVKLIVLLKKRSRKGNNRLEEIQENNNKYFEETNYEI